MTYTVTRSGEFQNDEASTGPQDAQHFREPGIEVGEVPHAERTGDDRETAAPEGQPQRIGLAPSRRASPPLSVGPVRHGVDAIASGLDRSHEHFMGEIAAHHETRAGGGEGAGKVARTAGNVEDFVSRLNIRQCDGFAPPGGIASSAEQPVDQFVPRRDAVEHPTNATCFVRHVVRRCQQVGSPAEFVGAHHSAPAEGRSPITTETHLRRIGFGSLDRRPLGTRSVDPSYFALAKRSATSTQFTTFHHAAT